MPPLTVCPDAADLRQFLEGQTSGAEAARLEEHLPSCPHCLQALSALSGDDELLRAVRNRGLAAPLPNPQWGAILQRIRQRRTPAALMNTGPLFMTTTEPSLMSENPDDMTHYLAPPQTPGELGRLGGYRVLRILGSGGMGTVYEAEDVALRRRVALKTMKPSAARQQPGARERFLREARAAAALNHDHIVPIYQVGEDRGVPYLAMPMLLGEMLEDRLKRMGRLPVAEALRIGRETAEGLAAAHDHGIVHRDIKPGNIWLESPSNRVKIVDFGLASCSEGDVQLTTPGTVLGTPAYMAPEQAGGPIDHRADLFSLGCVLYRMTTGRLPFPGASTMEILRNIAIQQPRSPRELNPEISPAMEQFMLRLLAKEREQRPVSAAVTAKVLQTMEQQLAATINLPAAKPPIAARIQAGPPPVAKLISPSPSDRATPQIRINPPAIDLNATTLDVAIRSGANAAPPRSPGGTAASLSAKWAALPTWFKSLSARHKVFLTAGIGGGLAICLLGLVLVLVLTLGRGRGSSSANQPNVPDDAGAATKLPPPKIVKSPGHHEITIPVGDALNPNSIVTRPATIKGLDTWDLISDHISNMSVTSLSFTRDGRLDIATGDGHTHWDFEKGALVPAPFGASYSAISPDLAVCARIGPQAVSLYEKEKPEIARTLLTPSVTFVNWSNDGQDIATYGTEGIRIWNPNKARERSSWNEMPVAPASGTFGAFAWLPDDQSLLAWRGGDSSVEQIEAESGKVLQKLPVERLLSVHLQPQGEKFATVAYNDNKIRVYELAGGKLLTTFPDASTASPAWSRDGKMLAFGVGSSVQVWASETWSDPKLLRTFDKPRQRSKAVAFAPHGETLFSYDVDGKLRLWEVKTGQHRGTILFLEGSHWLAVAPEGDYRASNGAEEAGLFRFQVLEPKATFDLSPKAFADKYGWTNDPNKPLEALR